jgi:hypothetical protein
MFSSMRWLAFFSLVLLGCSTDDGVAGDVDSGTSSDDAAVATDDAGSDDPLNAAPACTSNRMWVLGNHGSTAMNPGLACIDCHNQMRRAPSLTAAGTLYPTGHEPDLCNGGFAGATVEIHDAAGHTATLTANSVGNFFYQGALTLPITASVHYMGRTREMTTPAMSGDCNSCHTQSGLMSAPGRITLP